MGTAELWALGAYSALLAAVTALAGPIPTEVFLGVTLAFYVVAMWLDNVPDWKRRGKSRVAEVPDEDPRDE